MSMSSVVRVPHAGGFSLIEALVALVISSFLMLVFMKMAGLQLHRAQESRTRAFAIHQMQGMAAAVSVNPAYWVSKSAVPVTLNLQSPTGGPDCERSRCNPAQLAQYDIARWGATLALRLSAPEATVACQDNLGTSVCKIELSWQERGAAPSARSKLALRFTP